MGWLFCLGTPIRVLDLTETVVGDTATPPQTRADCSWQGYCANRYLTLRETQAPPVAWLAGCVLRWRPFAPVAPTPSTPKKGVLMTVYNEPLCVALRRDKHCPYHTRSIHETLA